MTRDELIEAIRGRLKARDRDDYDAGFRAGIETAAELAEQLDSPPAMTWQSGAPSVLPVDAHVEGIGAARLHADDYGEIVFSTAPDDGVLHDCVPLGNRRWCLIPAPPALPKRGDA